MNKSGTAKGLLVWFLVLGISEMTWGAEIDFNRDIRSILSNRCLTCHGPDPAERKGDLRLDTQAGSRADLGGYAAVKPGDPARSELLQRVMADEDDRMPPAKSGPRLTADEVALLRQWILEGGEYAEHWAYVPPSRPRLPSVDDLGWVRNPVDRFILSRQEAEGMQPSGEADRWALARRAAIDLTGLPPRAEQVEAFMVDESEAAFDRYVDGLLHDDAFGERWARVWLDLARYADSAGYADDPPRTIWGYRDYVIRSLNDNMPFDQFTIEQLGGDLLPEPTNDQLIATAFHRNTMTNNEGGTSNEQFRNEAIVDRVNTTMQVWMGTTMACAQCHNHKYDPITQQEYFEFFAFFNNTEDNDLRNEQPTLALYTDAQKKQKLEWEDRAARLKYQIERPNDVVKSEQARWEARLSEAPVWSAQHPSDAAAEGRLLKVDDNGTVRASGEKGEKDIYRVDLALENETLTGIRLETLAQDENFAVSKVSVTFNPEEREDISGRFLRLELPGKGKILSLAEVEVFSDGANIAVEGKASQSSTASGGDASRGNDGNTNGQYREANSTTHTETSQDPWWEVDLGKMVLVDEVKVWNRTDGGNTIRDRLQGFRVKLLREDRSVVWESAPSEIPDPSLSLSLSGARSLPIVLAVADYEQNRFPAAAVLQGKVDANKAWAVGGKLGEAHELTLVLSEPLEGATGVLGLTIKQAFRQPKHLIDGFAISFTDSERIGERSRLPANIREILTLADKDRTESQRQAIRAHYRTLSPTLKPERDELAVLEKKLRENKPVTTVPIFRELMGDKRRKTHIQVRGNYLRKEGEVSEGTPAAFHPLPKGAPKDRLTLARWLVSRDNPLTARVIVNRHWEQLFGKGIVLTSEEFGSQGELPTHPALLDWLAVELMDSGWDLKHLLKLMVTSATYRQSSILNAEVLARDPDNRFYARGPRFRLSAEMIRDQALSVGGLLSDKKFGPPARPVQPQMGLAAAFGSGIDWKPSEGADRYRRGIYTQWRRSNPYPSMTTFDAPTREVCTVRRPRSNTPLQALVTLNDPVYVEAAQGFARRIVQRGGGMADQMDWAIRTALIRPSTQAERDRLETLYHTTKAVYDQDLKQAKEMATIPLGEVGEGADLSQLATWTVVANVILNLDEIFLKR